MMTNTDISSQLKVSFYPTPQEDKNPDQTNILETGTNPNITNRYFRLRLCDLYHNFACIQ